MDDRADIMNVKINELHDKLNELSYLISHVDDNDMIEGYRRSLLKLQKAVMYNYMKTL